MKTVIWIGLFLVAISFWQRSETYAADLSDIPADKRMHFGVAAASHMACSVVSNAITQSIWASKIGCWVLVNTAGVVKELTDPLHKGDREAADVYANMAGSGVSFLTLSMGF